MKYYPVTDGQRESDAYEPIAQYAPAGSHSQKRIMKPFAFTKPHEFRVFRK